MQVNKIIQGNTLEILRTLPDESVDCLVTSPPYWALRDYQTAGQIWDGDPNCQHEWNSEIKKWHGDRGKEKSKEVFDDSFQVQGTKHATCGRCGAWRGSLGLEPTFHLYIKHLCDIFDEAKRVLKKTGGCWVNIGDTYSAMRWSDNKGTSFMAKGKNSMKNYVIEKDSGLPEKCLCQIPSRFAIEMTNRGWILRNKIVWWKPNCMPSSAKDRFTVDFEEVFFFTKNQRYYFETQYEPWTDKNLNDTKRAGLFIKYGGKHAESTENKGVVVGNPAQGRNKRTVWRITTKPFREAHFATFPEELAMTPIKATCPESICVKCGKARERIIKQGEFIQTGGSRQKDTTLGKEQRKAAGFHQAITTGYTDCGCGAGWESGITLDPFMGAGTTAVVAKKLKRNYVGIELNPEYIKMAERRIAGTPTPLI